MPGQEQYPEEESLEAPEKLVEALGQLHKEGIFVPPAVDQAVLRAAGKHLRRLERPRARRKSWLPWAAMAACLALAVWLTERFSSPVRARPFAREDINRDGRVDVLDAFALARRIDTGGTLDPGWDINGDGHIDRVDVNAIAARAVSLAQSGPEQKRSANSRAGDPHAAHRSARSSRRIQSSVLVGSRLLRLVLRTVSDYRDLGVSERSAAFTPLPLGTPCVVLRIFPTAGKGSTLKRPEGRAPGALGWGAKQILRTQPRSVWWGSPAGWWQDAGKSKEDQS